MTSPATQMQSSGRNTPALLSSAVVVCILLIFANISFAALIFKGTLNPYLGQGISLIMVGTLVLILIVTRTSSMSGQIAAVQEVPVGILAVLGSDIVRQMDGAPIQQVFATMLGAIFVSSIATGICFWFLGRFRLGQLVRYIPYPVIGGFLAGTGWLLAIGAIQVMTDVPLGTELFTLPQLLRWLPGCLVGVAALFAVRRHNHFLMMPALLIGAIAMFYLALAFAGMSIADAMAGGWLLGPLPAGTLWNPSTPLAILDADWVTVFRHHGISLAAIALVSALALLLNVSALEIALDEDADLDGELRSTGIANLVAAFVPCPAGFASVSDTVLGQRLGGSSPYLGLLVAILLAGSIVLGNLLIDYIPRWAAGGLLFFLGLTFLVEWLYDSWRRFSIAEYILVWLILLAIILFGFLEGILVGTLLAAILFVIKYSQIDAVRHVYTRAEHEGRIIRKPAAEQTLKEYGEAIAIVELQGFLFFGAAHRLGQRLQRLYQRDGGAPLHFLLLDFRLVTGMDSSTGLSFDRILRHLDKHDVVLALASLSPALQESWQQLGLANAQAARVRTFATRNEGLVWCEQQLLSIYEQEAEEHVSFIELVGRTIAQRTTMADLDLSSLYGRIQYIHVGPGERVVEQGEQITGLLYVEEGEVVVQLEQDADQGSGHVKALRHMEAGTILGEMSYYLTTSATASVVAVRHSVLARLKHHDLDVLAEEEPEIALAIHHILGRDLSNKLVRDSRSLRLQNG